MYLCYLTFCIFVIIYYNNVCKELFKWMYSFFSIYFPVRRALLLLCYTVYSTHIN